MFAELLSDWSNAKPVKMTGEPESLWNCCRNGQRPDNFGTAANLEVSPCLTHNVPLLNERGEVVDHETSTEPVHLTPADPAELDAIFWTVYMRHEGEGVDALGDFPSFDAAFAAAKSMRAAHPAGDRLPINVFEVQLIDAES